VLENTQLGGIPYEPVLSPTSFSLPNSIDEIIGPSAAATLKHGKKFNILFFYCHNQQPTTV